MTGPSSPPDGGWGWVIVASAFLCHVLGGAVIGSLGVLYRAWLDEFGLGKGVTSWILSLAFGVLFCIGPVASTLSNRFSYASVAVVGSILASGGYIVSCWATSVPFLIVFIGIVTGAGSGLTYVPCVAVVTSYFKKNLPLVTGIYTSGVGLGSFLMAPLVNYLDDLYGWRGALLITGAVVAHTIAGSLLLTPFKAENHHEEDTKGQESEKGMENEMEEETKHVAVEVPCVLVHDAHWKEPVLTHKLTLNGCVAHDSLHAATNAPSNQNADSTGNSSSHTKLIGGGKVSPSSSDFKTKELHGVANYYASGVPHEVGLQCTDDNDGRPKSPLAVIRASDTTTPYAKTKSVQCLRLQARIERSTNSMGDLSHKKRHPLFSSQSLHNVQNLRNRSRKELSKSLRNFDLHLLGSFKVLFHEDKLGEQDRVNLLASEAEDTRRSHGEISEAEAETNSSLLKDQHSFDRREDASSPHPPPSQSRKLLQSFFLTFALLRDRTFFILFISNFFTCLSYSTPLIFLADRAVDNNIGKTMAAAFISVTGVGNILGRLSFGVIADRLFSSPLICYIAVVCLNAVSTMLSPLCGELVVLHGIYAFLYGLSIGGIAVLAVMVTIELMGRDKVATAFGLYLLSAGVGSVLGPPLGGWLFDWTQTYTLTFIVTGFFTLFSAVLLLPLEVSRRRRRSAALSSDDP